MSTPYFPAPTPGGPPRRRWGALIALIALVVLCGVAAAFLVLLTSEEKQDTQAKADDEPAAVAAVPVGDGATPPPPIIEPLEEEAPRDVKVTIETTPPGAEVFSGGESIGITPIQRRFAKADEGQVWQVFLDGYQVEEIDVGLDTDFHSEVVLKKLAPDAPPQRVAKPTPRTEPKQATADATDKPKPRGDSGQKKPVKASDRRGAEEHKVITRTTGASVPD